MEQGLATLAPILPDPETPSQDDIRLFPILRSLSIVRDLDMLLAVRAYRDEMAARSRIPLFFDLVRAA